VLDPGKFPLKLNEGFRFLAVGHLVLVLNVRAGCLIGAVVDFCKVESVSVSI